VKRSSEGKGEDHLGELEGVLALADLQCAGDEDEHAAGGAGRQAVDGGNLVLARSERKGGELLRNSGGAHVLVALEGEHGALLVEPHQRRPVGVERRVVVVHERPRHAVGVHWWCPPLARLA
jgi:hypothetical protein